MEHIAVMKESCFAWLVCEYHQQHGQSFWLLAILISKTLIIIFYFIKHSLHPCNMEALGLVVQLLCTGSLMIYCPTATEIKIVWNIVIYAYFNTIYDAGYRIFNTSST